MGAQLTACVFFTWLFGSLHCCVFAFYLEGARCGQGKQEPHAFVPTTDVQWPRALLSCDAAGLGCPALPAEVLLMRCQPPGS